VKSVCCRRASTFELHIDEEVDSDNKLYKWYERSMVRMVHGTNGLRVVRIVNGTKSPDTVDRGGTSVTAHTHKHR